MSKRAWWLAAAAVFCCAWGGNQFTPLLLLYRAVRGYSTVTVDAFLGAYVLGLVPGLLMGGPLSDRYGRRALLLPGTALSAVASGVLALGTFSSAGIYLGRMLSGAAVGVAMAVGTSWVKELSQAPYEPFTTNGTAVRRGALALTLGFGIGAGVAGALAQWAPVRTVVPYAVHMALTVPVLLALRQTPETRILGRPGRLRDHVRVSAAGHPRFRWIVMPLAPWVFGAAGIAYAVMPQLVSGRVGHWKLAFATLLTVVTLSVGAIVQPLVKRLDSTSTARASLLAMTLMAAGLAICAVDARTGAPWGAPVGASVLGAAYGIAIVAGLLEISRIGHSDDLPDQTALIGVYYALSYLGFLLPAVLAGLAHWWSYPTLLAALGVLSVACLVVIGARSRRFLPVTPDVVVGDEIDIGARVGVGVG